MNWKTNLWVLCISSIFTSASYTMIIPFLPVYLMELGVAQESVAMWSGAVFSVSFLIGGIMAPLWGKIADRSGKRMMALRAGFCLSVVYFLGSIVTSPEQLFGVRALQGFANGFMPASLALVSSCTPESKLGFSLGMMQTGMIAGGVIGPLLGGSLAHIFGMRASFVVAAVLLLLVTIAVAFLVKEPKLAVDVNPGSSIFDDIRGSLKNKILIEMLALTVVVQMAMMILQPVVTLYIAQLQGGMEGAVFASGVVFSLGGIAGAIAAPFWGRYGQTSGYFKAMAIAFLGAGIFNFSQYFPSTVFGFAALQFLFGLFIVGVSPSISAVVVTSTDASFRGRVFGLVTTSQQFGAMIGPLLGGAVSAAMGIQYIFILTGCLLLAISAAIANRYLRGSVQK